MPLLLGPLADNGGPTLTHLPLSNSSAVNAAFNSDATVDQRGLSIVDVPDICAAEFQGTATSKPFSDEDRDGLLGFLELAIGTDPDVADFDSPRLPNIAQDADGNITFTFGRGSEFLPGTILTVERSRTLQPGSFEEVFQFEFNTASSSSSPDSGVSATVGLDEFILTDITDPQLPQEKSFYRVSADVIDLPE